MRVVFSDIVEVIGPNGSSRTLHLSKDKALTFDESESSLKLNIEHRESDVRRARRFYHEANDLGNSLDFDESFVFPRSFDVESLLLSTSSLDFGRSAIDLDSSLELHEVFVMENSTMKQSNGKDSILATDADGKLNQETKKWERQLASN